jgi:hypothetical protein
MPFFTFTKKSTRVQATEKKPITIGPFVERCPPGDLANRVNLVSLEQAQKSKKIKLRTVIPCPDSPEMVAEVGIWENELPRSGNYPSSLKRQPHCQKRSVSGSSTATSSSAASTDSDDTLLPEVFDYYVCHKPLLPAEPSDTIIANVDQSCLFAELEAACNPVHQSVLLDELEALCAHIPAAPVLTASPIKKTNKKTKHARRLVRFEDTLIPLHTAFLRSDIRYRPEGFEMN